MPTPSPLDALGPFRGYEPLAIDTDTWPGAVAGYGYTGQLAEQVMQRAVRDGLVAPFSGRYQDELGEVNRAIKRAAGIDEPFSNTTQVRFMILKDGCAVIDSEEDFWSGHVRAEAAAHFQAQAEAGRFLSGMPFNASVPSIATRRRLSRRKAA
jgi:hypothetical protein